MNFSDLRLNCIKDIPIDTVSPKPLHELGFPLDAPVESNLLHDPDWQSFFYKTYKTPFSVVGSSASMYVRYILDGTTKEKAFDNTLSALKEYDVTAEELIAELRSGCIYDLTESDTQTLFEEFSFIIKTLLPRQLSDIYYSFNIQPNPAHSVFFDLAAEKLNIERYSDLEKNNYGQFIKYPLEGVERRIISGEPFQSIYRETCATKQMISDAWGNVCISQMPSDKCAYHLRKIEFALFKLSKKFHYTIEKTSEQRTLFNIFNSDDKKILTIAYLSSEDLSEEYDYEKVYSKIARSEHTLVIDFDEIEENGHISSLIRNAMEDRKTIEDHKESRKKSFTYERALDNSFWNYDAIRIARLCGCFTCLSVFKSDEVTEWDIAESACCPYCGEASVIADSQGYKITKEFLNEVKLYAENDGYLEYDE